MTGCSVLRCPETASSSFALAPYSNREVPVCPAHKTSLAEGTPWMANPGTTTGALTATAGSVEVTIFMGPDLPFEPRVREFGVSPTIGSEIGFSVNAGTEGLDGQQQEVTFWMTEEQGRLLGSWLTG